MTRSHELMRTSSSIKPPYTLRSPLGVNRSAVLNWSITVISSWKPSTP